jgi:hypothetical protein
MVVNVNALYVIFENVWYVFTQQFILPAAMAVIPETTENSSPQSPFYTHAGANLTLNRP